MTGKASMLLRARQAGLPVPDMYVVPDTAAAPQLPEGVWAVRSAFAPEDTSQRSHAGEYDSFLDVPTAGVASAIDRLRQTPGAFRKDVIVMRMVRAQHAGVAFTEHDHEDDRVEYTHGLADRLLRGAENGETLELEKLRRWERPAAALPPFAQRLARLLRDARQAFGPRDWDVEFADDGVVCWLVQIRPVTRPTRRNEVFTLANHKEILPDPPSRFMAGLIEECGPRLFAYYRRFDGTLPAHRSLIEVFAGRPLLNLSLLTDLMRAWGLPTALVTGGAGGPALPQSQGWRPLRALSRARALLRMAWARPAGGADRWLAIAETPAPDLAHAIEKLAGAYVALVHDMFAHTAAMSLPLAILEAAGTLAAHESRHETITTRMMRDWARLPRPRFLELYGHRGIYESDIARPRYAEAPPAEPPAGWKPRAHSTRRRLREWLTLPVWWIARRPLRAREQWRHDMMRVFAALRRELLRHSSGVDLWQLSPEEARRWEKGWRPSPAFWRTRQTEMEADRAIRLPELVRRFDRLEPLDAKPAGHSFSGSSLTPGDVTGLAWVLREPTGPPPPASNEPWILIAPAIDSGWMATLALCAGAAIETGGDLSHGSILIREIGLPALTNAPGITAAFQTGERVRLRAGQGLLERA
jgi:pyruvate,water dikinase